ncbi:regulatory protein RecX [Porticoccus sp. W117]|uniref:regulatory protein RecX n=1 Tax=Porticoccus sp. W117 TaxID=3054777 RepID=UPI0025960FC8|nr:regulatory protein RecX [Porticoccus sp. W117]MDM3870302.1 regulatory protein RecX [Porticoccus sp. W117]
MSDVDTNTVRLTAMNLLARREHSLSELRSKLAARYGDCNEIAPVLEALQQQGLQSDQRFAEAFLRSRLRKGQGPYRIRNELKQRGVSAQVMDELFQQQETDWFELARQVAQRRFGVNSSADIKEQSKRARFLQYRGFSGEQIRYALEHCQQT